MEFKTVDKGERSRTYVMPDPDHPGEALRYTVKGVQGVNVSASGSHRLNTATGKVYVPAKWLAIEFDMDEWSF